MESKTTFAIIGGGASGTIAAIHLLDEFKGPLKIYLLEKRQKALFRGVAYSSELEFEPLNVPAGKMSIFSDYPLDFYYWLKSRHLDTANAPVTPDSFVSRRWFGDYITERLVEAKAKVRNASLDVIITEAVDIVTDKKAERYKVKLSDGEFVEVDYLIFATGNEAPGDIMNNPEKALLGKKYIANPWVDNPFENLSPDDDVLIIGSGLSMVDHALSLYRRKHRGKIYSFSRHGYLPLPQQIGQEGKIDLSADSSSILHVMKELRSKIEDAERQGHSWQQVINAIRDETPIIWKRLNTGSKRLFLTRLKPFWEIHRHRMPAESSALIEEIKLTGKFGVLAGRQTGITVDNGRLFFRFSPNKGAQERSVKVDFVINCTGPSAGYSGYSNNLISNLITKGWMKPDELKLGIETGYNGEIITVQGNPLPNAFAIGPLRKALEWESTAIREIKMQAEQLALDIVLNYNKPESLIRLCAK